MHVSMRVWRHGTQSKHGAIAEWDTSKVTSTKEMTVSNSGIKACKGKVFNADVSKWQMSERVLV